MQQLFVSHWCASTASWMPVFLAHPHKRRSSLYIQCSMNDRLPCRSLVTERRPPSYIYGTTTPGHIDAPSACACYWLYTSCPTTAQLTYPWPPKGPTHRSLGLQEATGTKNAPKLYSIECCNYFHNNFKLYNFKLQIYNFNFTTLHLKKFRELYDLFLWT